jgi:hypothetical protein
MRRRSDGSLPAVRHGSALGTVGEARWHEMKFARFSAGANGIRTLGPGKPDAPYAALAIERMKQFIRNHTTG